MPLPLCNYVIMSIYQRPPLSPTCTVEAVPNEAWGTVTEIGTHSVHTHSLGVTGVATGQTLVYVCSQGDIKGGTGKGMEE